MERHVRARFALAVTAIGRGGHETRRLTCRSMTLVLGADSPSGGDAATHWLFMWRICPGMSNFSTLHTVQRRVAFHNNRSDCQARRVTARLQKTKNCVQFDMWSIWPVGSRNITIFSYQVLASYLLKISMLAVVSYHLWPRWTNELFVTTNTFLVLAD